MVFHSGQVLARPGEDVGDDAHGVTDGINVGAARDVLLEDVVLDSAGELADVRAGAAGDSHVEGEQDAGRGVDGHRGGDAVERNVREEALHVFDRVDGDADFADFADRHGRIGVVADLRRQVEGDGKAGGSLVEEEFVTAVALFCVAHACILAHGPETAAVHGGLDAAGEGKFAGKAEVAVGGKGGEVFGGVDGFSHNSRSASQSWGQTSHARLPACRCATASASTIFRKRKAISGSFVVAAGPS